MHKNDAMYGLYAGPYGEITPRDYASLSSPTAYGSTDTPYASASLSANITPPPTRLSPLAAAVRASIMGLGFGLASSPMMAATITVNNAGDAGVNCTLREAITSINNGGVEPGCVATGAFGTDDTINFTGGLSGANITLGGTELSVTASDLTIDASTVSGVTVNGNNTSRVFNVGNSAGLTIDNLTITGGNASGNGGGIYVGTYATLTANNSTFTNNTTGPNKYGGAIFGGSASVITVENSLIDNNYAGDDGGGIYSNYGSIFVNASTISNNSTGGDEGGGIWSIGNGNQSLSVTNSQITGNSAFDEGGGIFTTGDLDIYIFNSNISNNSTTKHGGGIAVDYNQQSLTIVDSYIDDNTTGLAAQRGGGLYISGSSASQTLTASLINAHITGNQSSGHGGGIYAQYADLNVRDSFIDTNNAGSGTSASVRGGGLFLHDSNLALRDTSVSGNSATAGGGGIAAQQNSFIEVKYGNTIDNNNAGAYGGFGGGLHLSYSYLSLWGGNNSISGNSAQNYGGGVFLNEAVMGDFIGDISIRNNTLTGAGYTFGGGVHLQNNSTLNLDNADISSNISSFGGGGVHAGYSGNTIDLTDSTVANNTSTWGGGIALTPTGLYTAPSTLSLDRTTLSGNSALENGGGLYIWSGGATITNSTISGNRAQNSGIRLVGGVPSTINNSTIASNVTETGYGIQAYLYDTTVSNSIIANSSGGAGDCQGFVTTLDPTTIVEDGSCGAARAGDPKLGPLAFNGGPTRTHMLDQRSIAINTGENSTCENTDQRGETRPLSVEDACDVGAVEFFNSDIPGFFVIPLPNGKVIVVPE